MSTEKEEKKATVAPVNTAVSLSRWRECLCLKADTDEQGEKPKNTSAAKWRWAMLGILSINICVSYIPYYTFVPIPRQSMQVFNVDEAALNVLCILYALVFVPAAFVTGPIVGFLGCRWTFVAAMATTVFGCALRAGPTLRADLAFCWNAWRGMPPTLDSLYTSTTLDLNSTGLPVEALLHTGDHIVPDFWWLVVGQAFCALGQPLLVNPTSEMAAEWFPPHERPTAAMVANLMNFVGSSLSFVLPPLVVKEVHSSLQETEQEIASLMRIQFWIAVFGFLMTLILYRPAPKNRYVSHMRSQMTCITETLTILRSRDFWLVNGFFTAYVSVCHAFDAIEGVILEHYGYSASLTSWTGISCAVCSVLSTICEARCISSASAYRGALLVAAGFLALSQFLGYLCLQFRMDGMVFVFAVGVMGLATPGWGCSCELASEVCFPARESTVVSMLEAFSNLGGVFGIIWIQYMLDAGYGASVLVILGGGMLVASTGLVCLSGKLKRTEAEAAEEQNAEEIELQAIAEEGEAEIASKGVPKEELKQEEIDCMQAKWSRKRTTLTWIAIGAFLLFCRVLLFLPQSQLPEDMSIKPGSLMDLWQPAPWDQATLSTSAGANQPSAEPVAEPVVEPATEPTEAVSMPSAEPKRKPPKTHTNKTKFSKDLHTNKTKDIPNYVISCSGKKNRLGRFRKYMKKQGLNFTVFPCVKATAEEVTKAISDDLLGPGALLALSGTTKQGLSRVELLGNAISHLRLLQLIAGSPAPTANVFEDQEVLHDLFALRRRELLAVIKRSKVHWDLVKLDAKQPGGMKISFSGHSHDWLHGNIFKMVSTLSPMVNSGLGDYIVTKEGAGKIVKFAGARFDTFGRWETFDQFMLSRIIKDLKKQQKLQKKKVFVGLAVQTSVFSFNCHAGRSGTLTPTQVARCKK